MKRHIARDPMKRRMHIARDANEKDTQCKGPHEEDAHCKGPL